MGESITSGGVQPQLQQGIALLISHCGYTRHEIVSYKLLFRYDSGIAQGAAITWNDGITLDTGGDVGIGIPTATYRLDVQDTNATYVARFHNDGNAAARYGVAVWAGKDTPTVNSDCRWVYLMAGSGGAWSYIGYSTSTPYAAFYAASDQRLKENIKPTEVSALDKINALEICSFDWKDRSRPSQTMGFIAQQVQEVIPEMIAEEEDGILSVTESPLVKYLVKAMQEQQRVIDGLKDRIETLEQKN